MANGFRATRLARSADLARARAVLDQPDDAERAQLEASRDRLASRSLAARRALVECEGFVPFFREATPIEVLEQSRIGSRPARRSGRHTLADLRAIPWVFAWNQARSQLSGWYGSDSALESLANEAPEAFEHLRQDLLTWAPLQFAISNAATALTWTCPDTMARYAALSTDGTHAPALLRTILDERAHTCCMLEALYGGALAERRPGVHAAVSARREALAVLHARQIALLARYRGGEPELLSELLLTGNALAMGLGVTG